MSAEILLVGYGNELRTDDGIGPRVAERLAQDGRMRGIAVMHLHQLAPELALDFSRADLVVLVDASHDLPAGEHGIRPVARSSGAHSTWTHHIDAASLIELALELYGRCPEVFVVSVGVESVEVGERLTGTLEAALPSVADAVAEFVLARAHALDYPLPMVPGRA